MEQLAKLIDRRAKATVLAALAFFAIATALGTSVAKRLDPFGADDPSTESVIADERLHEVGAREIGVVVLVDGVDAGSRAGRARISSLERRIASRPEVVATLDALSGGSDFVSTDGKSSYIAVALEPTSDRERQEAAARLAGFLDGEPGVTVGGPALAERQVNTQVEHDLRTAELYAFPALLLLSLLFFRSFVAAMLPLLVGGLAILGTLLVLRVASELTSVSIFALNVATPSASGWRSTTAFSSSPGTGRRSRAPERVWTPCVALSPPPGVRSSSAR